MFYRIVPKFGRQSRPIWMHFGRHMCSKKDVPIRAPWRRHSSWDDYLPDLFRGFPRGPFRHRGPFGDMEAHFEDMARRMEKMMSPKFFDHYYVRPRCYAESASRTEVEQVKYDSKTFEVKLDVQHFTPEELKVKLAGNKLTITGKHESKQDEHGYVSREFHRELEIPEDVDLETFQSMMSEDGVMTLQADIKGAENIQERPIEIKFELKKDKDDNK